MAKKIKTVKNVATVAVENVPVPVVENTPAVEIATVENATATVAVENVPVSVETQQSVLAEMGIVDREEPKFSETVEKKFNLSAALREVLSEDIDATWEDARCILIQKYPGAEYNEKSGMSTLSMLRSKMKNGEDGGTNGRKQSINPAISMRDLQDVLTFAKTNFGSVDRFYDAVVLMEDASSLVGGLSQLRKAVEQIKEFSALLS